jgi:hypothetical protein
MSSAHDRLRRLRDIGRNTPRLITRQQCRGSSPRLILEIDVGECLSVVVAPLWCVHLLDRPRAREAATWAHMAAQKRCSSDLSDETLCRWNDRFTL